MSYHIKLSDPCCLLCRHCITVSEKTIAGTGSTYRGCTLSFDFPAHGHRFGYGTVCFDGREESWRLCRYPPCPTCQKSPMTFVLHIDCVRLLKRCVPRETLLHTWLLGSWSYPWPGAYHDAPKPYDSLGSLAGNIICADSDLRSLVEKVAGLPPEIRNLVIGYTNNSLLWRFAKVLSHLKFIDHLKKDIKTLLPSTLDCWIRGKPIVESNKESLNGNGNERQSLKCFRMGVDDLGIRSIQLLESRSTLPNGVLPDCPWYIIEDIAYLDDLKIESNGYFIRVQPHQHLASIFTLWNTPLPPDLSLCRIIQNCQSKPKRMRCITLDDNLTGLSVFCTSTRIYWVQAHTRYSPSAVDAYWRILLYKKDLIWLYFPLTIAETIQDAWICQKGDRGLLENLTLVARTTRGRVSIFGPYIDLEDNYELHNLSNGPISQLVHDDPEAGQLILYFGAYCPLVGNTSKLGPLKQLEVPNDRIENGFFYSFASFENVEQVHLFLDEIAMDKLRSECCIGILITYNNGSKEALGQCRIGLSTSIEVLRPITFHWKEIVLRQDVFGVNVRFSSRHTRFEAPDVSGPEASRANDLTFSA